MPVKSFPCWMWEWGDLEQLSDVQLGHHDHGVQSEHVLGFGHHDAIAGVQVWIQPLLVYHDNHTLEPARSDLGHTQEPSILLSAEQC